MKRARRTRALLLLVGAVACAPSTQRSQPRVQQNIITADEIREANVANVYQLVQSVRPNWLIERGPTNEIQVYIGRSNLGTIEALQDIAASSVTSVQFLGAAEANYRVGQGNTQGAIVLSTAPIERDSAARERVGRAPGRA